jgi:hypothetical protein
VNPPRGSFEPAALAAADSPNTPAVPGREAWFWRAGGVLLWLAPVVAISILVATQPDGRTVTPLYHQAVTAWNNREPLYQGIGGMNYLPQFVLVFGPFHLLGSVCGDILWRIVAVAGLAAGLWLFCGAIDRAHHARAFTLVSVLAMPICLPAMANGQANAHLAAALLLSAWCLKTQRLGWAAACLWLAAAIKPLGFAAVGLALAVYPQLWWRLALGLPLFMGVPFLFAPVHYTAAQFAAAWTNLRECSAVTENRFADFNGVLRTFGLPLAAKPGLVVRALAGGVFMFACWMGPRRESEPRRALLWLSATAAFLMLFNPMTEANSYVILAPAIGLISWHEFQRGNRRFGWFCVFMALTMGLLPEPLQHLPALSNTFAIVWHPALTMIFAGALAWQSLRRSDAQHQCLGPESEPVLRK